SLPLPRRLSCGWLCNPGVLSEIWFNQKDPVAGLLVYMHGQRCCCQRERKVEANRISSRGLRFVWRVLLRDPRCDRNLLHRTKRNWQQNFFAIQVGTRRASGGTEFRDAAHALYGATQPRVEGNL